MNNDLIKLLLPAKEVRYNRLKPEQKICVEFANHMRMLTLEGKLPYIWYHIPNEFLPSARKNYIFELKLKHTGKIPGVPDYCFIGKHDSFFIEFKAGERDISSPQQVFKGWCDQQGVEYFICRGAREGIDLINKKTCFKVRGVQLEKQVL